MYRQNMYKYKLTSDADNNRCSGFTLLELLIVIAIIALLIAISAVSLTGVMNRGRTTKSNSLVQAVKIAILSYRNEFGELPPEVGPSGLWRGAEGMAEWDYDIDGGQFTIPVNGANPGSAFTIAKHLMGKNITKNVNGKDVEVDGVSGPGMRRPNTADGYFWDTSAQWQPTLKGKVYQPFIDARDESAFVQTTPIPGGSAAGQQTAVAVDAFGGIIRYYNFKNPGKGAQEPTYEERLISIFQSSTVTDPDQLQSDPSLIPTNLRNIGFAIVAPGEDGFAGYWGETVTPGGGTEADELTLSERRTDNLVETGS